MELVLEYRVWFFCFEFICFIIKLKCFFLDLMDLLGRKFELFFFLWENGVRGLDFCFVFSKLRKVINVFVILVFGLFEYEIRFNINKIMINNLFNCFIFNFFFIIWKMIFN